MSTETVDIPSAVPKLKPKGKHGGARPGGGRPRNRLKAEQDAVEAARSSLRAALPAVAQFWLDGLKHGLRESGEVCYLKNHDCATYRLRCSEQIAKRGGLPEMQQVRQEVVNDQRPVLVFSFPDPFQDVVPDTSSTTRTPDPTFGARLTEPA
jgi:hypothetical protein